MLFYLKLEFSKASNSEVGTVTSERELKILWLSNFPEEAAALEFSAPTQVATLK